MKRQFKTPPGVPKGTIWPDRWASGPDPVLHEKYRVWGQQRNQAIFRNEPWDLPFLEWVAIWGDLYQHKGKNVDCLCMSRVDLELPWHKDNVKIITRREHFKSNRNKQGKFEGRQQ
jgi:hypothetical protein